MTENRENWLYPDASGLYFPHDGFIIRATDGKQYDYEEECGLLNEYDKKYNEYRKDVLRLEEELDYYKTKCSSLEEGLVQQDKKIAKLEKNNKELKELVSEVDNELEIRDVVCGAGKFRLEEWGKHRYHQFYKGDEELEDETVVIMLMELEKENRTLKLLVQNWEQLDDEKDEQLEKMDDSLKRLVEENKQLQQELFESEVDYYTETFRDDYEDRIIDLKKEFKERFGRDFE